MVEKIRFEGFEPSYRIKKLAKDVLKRVEECSPSQACHLAVISKNQDGFLGKIKISSLAGIFCVESQASSPSYLLDELYGKMRRELNFWLKNRSFVNNK